MIRSPLFGFKLVNLSLSLAEAEYFLKEMEGDSFDPLLISTKEFNSGRVAIVFKYAAVFREPRGNPPGLS